VGELTSAINRLYLDANVFIALAEGSGPVSELLLELAGSQKPDEGFLFTSELSLAELLVHPCRDGDERVIQLYDNWTVSSGWLTVGPVDRDTLWSAALVRAEYSTLKLPDAIHLSTAVGFQCTHFLTADKRIPDTVQIPNRRHEVVRRSAPLEILRLDEDTLHMILKQRSQT
jgi:predicted nucleic acid-binding protein